jgi:hypothetical protein
MIHSMCAPKRQRSEAADDNRPDAMVVRNDGPLRSSHVELRAPGMGRLAKVRNRYGRDISA